MPRMSADTGFFDLYDSLMADETDVSAVLRHVAGVVCREFGAERTTIYLVDRSTQELVSSGVVGNVERRIRVPIGRSSLAGFCALSGRSFVVPDAYGDLGHVDPGLAFDASWDERTGFRTRDVMCAPALFKGKAIGVVQAMNSSRRPFSEADLVPLRSIARLVGYSLHHAALYEDIARLKHLDREKAEFIRIMVHELKSPVAAAKMTVDVIGHVNPSPDEIGQYLSKIGVRMDQLNEMIVDLLDLARVKSGAALGDVNVLDLAAEAGEVVEGYRERAEAKGLALEFARPPSEAHVRFDSKGLRLVISNLVSNAIKYTESGSVTVRVSKRDGRAVLEVEDSGIGVPEKDVPMLFREFFRASNAKRSRSGGTGVGLVGAKNLVERFGGEVEFRSVENEGSTFTVKFLLCEDADAPAPRVT
ncbi:MAG: GAF domain-containing sensor histidine kinase [Planctomycetota bacterium]|jgi:signal transduction histidine kinase